MDIKRIINIDSDIMGGTPVFAGTRVPIQSLFWHLEKNISIDAFLEDFPTVAREQVDGLLLLVEKTFEPQNITRIYEVAA